MTKRPLSSLHPPAGWLFVLAAALVLWLAVCLATASGEVTFYFRDLSQLFIPLKAFGAAQLREGRIPATNPTWALGQPFRGDPNSMAFYPGNLLYLALPFWTAFNLHLCLHWLLAGMNMALLARALAQSKPAALLAGLAYAGSGWMLSVLSFYTVATAAAWLPLVLLGGVRGGRRGVALGGIALGLALLAADPVVMLGVVPLVAVAIPAHGWRRGLATAAAVVAAGILVSLPQIVATLRIAHWTFRFGYGMLPKEVAAFTLQPGRLLELALPFPFGLPAFPGDRGLWAFGVPPRLYLSLYFGAVALILAFAGARRRPPLAGLALGGLALACIGRFSANLLQILFAGGFRSPEKLIVWTALALPLLAGEGLDRVVAGGERSAFRMAATGALLAAAAATVSTWLGVPRGEPAPARQHLLSGLVVAALLCGLAAWGVRRRSAGALLGVELLALLQLQPLVFLERTDRIRALAGAPDGPDSGPVLPVEQTYPSWGLRPSVPPGAEGPSWQVQREAFSLGPTPGILEGRSYPAAPNIDGMHHQLYTLLLYRLSRASWDERIGWCRALGARILVSPAPVASRHARLLRQEFSGDPLFFYRIAAPAPQAWWPERVLAAESPRRAFELLGSRPEPAATAVLPLAVPHRPGARVRLLAASPDRLVVDVAGGGGLLVVQRAFQNFWQAHAGDRRLQVLPADLALLGVVVPAGRHRVVLEISAWPEELAAVLSLCAAAGLLAVALGVRNPRRVATAPAS